MKQRNSANKMDFDPFAVDNASTTTTDSMHMHNCNQVKSTEFENYDNFPLSS